MKQRRGNRQRSNRTLPNSVAVMRQLFAPLTGMLTDLYDQKINPNRFVKTTGLSMTATMGAFWKHLKRFKKAGGSGLLGPEGTKVDSHVNTCTLTNLSGNTQVTALVESLDDFVTAPSEDGKVQIRSAKGFTRITTQQTAFATGKGGAILFLLKLQNGVTWTPAQAASDYFEATIAAQCDGAHQVVILGYAPLLPKPIASNYFHSEALIEFDLSKLLQGMQEEVNSSEGMLGLNRDMPTFKLGLAIFAQDNGAVYGCAGQTVVQRQILAQ